MAWLDVGWEQAEFLKNSDSDCIINFPKGGTVRSRKSKVLLVALVGVSLIGGVSGANLAAAVSSSEGSRGVQVSFGGLRVASDLVRLEALAYTQSPLEIE